MLKKLVVPLFSLAIATFGCSSSTTNTGTGGSGGTSATGGAGGHATGGSGGHATGGAGGSSATGGSGGHATGGAGGNATGGAGGHATGGAGGNATGGAGGAVTTDAGRMADCTVTMQDGTSTLTPAIFCQNLIAYCSNVTGFTLPTDYTQGMCEATYTKNATSQQNCQSYHLCWGVEGITNNAGADPMTHCKHATAMAVCLPPADAASGG